MVQSEEFKHAVKMLQINTIPMMIISKSDMERIVPDSRFPKKEPLQVTLDRFESQVIPECKKIEEPIEYFAFVDSEGVVHSKDIRAFAERTKAEELKAKIDSEVFPRKIFSSDDIFLLYMHDYGIYSNKWPEEYRSSVEETIDYVIFYD